MTFMMIASQYEAQKLIAPEVTLLLSESVGPVSDQATDGHGFSQSVTVGRALSPGDPGPIDSD